jgi:hypothetical protein
VAAAARYLAASTEDVNQDWRAHTTSGSVLSNATEYIKMLALLADVIDDCWCDNFLHAQILFT